MNIKNYELSLCTLGNREENLMNNFLKIVFLDVLLNHYFVETKIEFKFETTFVSVLNKTI